MVSSNHPCSPEVTGQILHICSSWVMWVIISVCCSSFRETQQQEQNLSSHQDGGCARLSQQKWEKEVSPPKAEENTVAIHFQ